jgi:TonB family protein
MTEDWTKWESQVIGGTFPLRRFLGRSNHSVVFLTEAKAQNLPDAAIKLVPRDPARAEAQLSYWRTAAALSHPHLIRLLDCGRCQLAGHQFLFVVMEYAEQTLAQLLPHRPLTADEARDTLLPTLEALTFLHGKNLVQGQLKPSNLLVVNDQLKLASDTVHTAGEATASIANPAIYDPPEIKSGRSSPAGDIWSLGVTMVEALTQGLPAWPDERSEMAALPTTLPAEFVGIVRRCLSFNPAKRPTIGELEAQINPTPQAPAASPPPISTVEAPRRAIPAGTSARNPLLLQVLAAALVVAAAVWVGLRLSHSHHSSAPPVADAGQISSAQAALPVPAPAPAASPPAPHSAASPVQNPRVSGAAPASVLHQEIPKVSRGARESIHGRLKVTVRVGVDRTGNVVSATLDNPGPSKYFARSASDAARKWRFAPADNQDHRVWLLRFEFTRSATTASADIPHS